MSAHISTDKTLLGVTGGLLVLTILTVAVHYLHLPSPWSIIVAMVVAAFKAALVALFFMHLWWDKRFNSILLAAGIAFFTLLVALTLVDMLFRPEVVPAF